MTASKKSDAFQNVKDGVDTNLEGIMENSLANHGTVEHQYQQYGEVRADIPGRENHGSDC